MKTYRIDTTEQEIYSRTYFIRANSEEEAEKYLMDNTPQPDEDELKDYDYEIQRTEEVK